jgi:hypothetical protein
MRVKLVRVLVEFRNRGTQRKPDSIDSDFRLDPAAASPESETHSAFVNGRPLTDVQLEYPHTSPHSVAPRFGVGRFFRPPIQ